MYWLLAEHKACDKEVVIATANCGKRSRQSLPVGNPCAVFLRIIGAQGFVWYLVAVVVKPLPTCGAMRRIRCTKQAERITIHMTLYYLKYLIILEVDL